MIRNDRTRLGVALLGALLLVGVAAVAVSGGATAWASEQVAGTAILQSASAGDSLYDASDEEIIEIARVVDGFHDASDEEIIEIAEGVDNPYRASGNDEEIIEVA